ncbi:hypothetical protein IP83_02660, partial [Novosphingobium sp. AAP93]
MGDLERLAAPGAAAPQDHVEIERPRAPALAAADAAEAGFEALKQGEDCGRIKPCGDPRGGVGVAATGGADGSARDDRRGDFDGEALPRYGRERGAQDLRRGAVAGMALVGAERDQILVASRYHLCPILTSVRVERSRDTKCGVRCLDFA